MNRNFHQSGFRTFIVEHVEKLLFGLAAAFALVLCWSGISNSGTARISASKTPALLLDNAQKAERHLDEFTWNDFKDLPDRDAHAKYKARVKEAQQEIEPTSYRSPNVLRPPYLPPRKKRQDPELFPVTHLQVRAGFSTAQKRLTRRTAADAVLEDPTPKKSPYEQPIPGPNRDGDRRRVSVAATGGKIEGVFFVSVTGLIPFRQQVEEYNRCFQNPAGYDPQRDTPNYLDYRLYRAEVKTGQEPVFRIIATRRTTSQTLKKWVAKTPGRGDNRPLINPASVTSMTMPLPAFDLKRERLDYFMRHQTIEKFAPPERVPNRPVAGETGLDDSVPPYFEGNDRLDDDYRREGQRDREQFSTMEEPPEFTMFRYIDLDVTPGKTYQYKIALAMEDPNDPDLRTTPAPSVDTLDLAVKKRVVAKNEAMLEKFRRRDPTDSVRNYFIRQVPISETSDAIKVPDGRRIILGSVRMPPIRKGRLPRVSDEPSAEMMALEFDRENATDVPATFRAYRGTLGNFSKDAEIPFWSEQVLRSYIPKGATKPGPYTFRTNMAVMDIDGGRVSGQGKLREVAEVLVWKDGKMSVISELDSREEFDKFTFPDNQKDARGANRAGRQRRSRGDRGDVDRPDEGGDGYSDGE